MTDSGAQTTVGADAELFVSRLRADLPALSSVEGETWIARAPGTLDVMGGVAEFTGSLTFSAPTTDAVLVAVLPRDDQRLRVACLDRPGAPRDNGRFTEIDWPLSAFYGDSGAVAPLPVVRERARQLDCPIKQAVLSVAHVLLDSKVASHLAGGFTFVVESSVPGDVDIRHRATIQAASLSALVRALQLEMGPRQLAYLCQQAQQSLVAVPSGIATQVAPFVVEPGRLLPVCCCPFEIGETISLPVGVTVAGIDCGARHRLAESKYIQARTAAFIGREIIRCVLGATADGARPWDGYLARVSVTDYVDRLRHRLPTKLKGTQFLERFGECAGELADVEPDTIYKVRSRTEHHIYEDGRVRQFAERLARAARTGERRALLAAGELMYASHWSYGQRCGLGSIETDLLVNLLRDAGPDRGIFGARVSGPGGGGCVVALMSDTAEARETVEAAVDTYRQRTGNTATVRRFATDGGPLMTVHRHP